MGITTVRLLSSLWVPFYPSKVDRSAAYYCRYVAKNVVSHGFTSKCEILVSYVIELSGPLSIMVETFNDEKVSFDIISNYIKENFSFNVSNIIKELDLKKPIYAETAGYGILVMIDFNKKNI